MDQLQDDECRWQHCIFGRTISMDSNEESSMKMASRFSRFNHNWKVSKIRENLLFIIVCADHVSENPVSSQGFKLQFWHPTPRWLNNLIQSTQNLEVNLQFARFPIRAPPRGCACQFRMCRQNHKNRHWVYTQRSFFTSETSELNTAKSIIKK